MSAEVIESILLRAMSDNSFAAQLFADPKKMLAGYDLTAEEVAIFQNLSWVEFDGLVSHPEQRKSMSVVQDHTGQERDN